MSLLLGCGEEVPRACDDCPVQENKRIVHVAFVKTGVVIPKSTPAQMMTAILAAELACDAVVIRNVSGSYDGGTLVEGKGPGKQVSRVNGGTHNVIFTDFNYVGNEEFWNAFKRKSQGYSMIYFTSERAWFGPKALSVSPKPAFDEDIQAFIEAEITVKWSSADNPVSYLANVDDLTNCQQLFDYAELDGFEPISGNQSTIDGDVITIEEGDNLNVSLDTGVTLGSVTVDSGTLPTGTAVSVSNELVVLSGTPSVAGTYEVIIRASNPCGISTEFTITIIVEA